MAQRTKWREFNSWMKSMSMAICLTTVGVALGTCSAAEAADAAEPDSDWIASVHSSIADSEYHITWQEKSYLHGLDEAWQAPNRSQNLRAYFTELGVRVISRTETVRVERYGGSSRLERLLVAPGPTEGACEQAVSSRVGEGVVDLPSVLHELTSRLDRLGLGGGIELRLGRCSRGDRRGFGLRLDHWLRLRSHDGLGLVGGFRHDLGRRFRLRCLRRRNGKLLGG